MEGYINNTAATAANFDEDGWFHTGDVGHYDEDGNFRIVDRIKEMIKVNTLQVSSSKCILYLNVLNDTFLRCKKLNY